MKKNVKVSGHKRTGGKLNLSSGDLKGDVDVELIHPITGSSGETRKLTGISIAEVLDDGLTLWVTNYQVFVPYSNIRSVGPHLG